MTSEDIAEVAHEINKAYCKSIGDDSQPAWADAPEWQRKSAINGVLFHVENPGVTPEQSHESWMREKAADGWTWGKEKDPALKTHPCFCEYSELPIEQRTKDYLFSAIVTALESKVGE